MVRLNLKGVGPDRQEEARRSIKRQNAVVIQARDNGRLDHDVALEVWEMAGFWIYFWGWAKRICFCIRYGVKRTGLKMTQSCCLSNQIMKWIGRLREVWAWKQDKFGYTHVKCLWVTQIEMMYQQLDIQKSGIQRQQYLGPTSTGAWLWLSFWRFTLPFILLIFHARFSNVSHIISF